LRVGYSAHQNNGTIRYNSSTNQIEGCAQASNGYTPLTSIKMAGPGISAMVSYGKVLINRANGTSVATDGTGCNLSYVSGSFTTNPVQFTMQFAVNYTTQLIFICNNVSGPGNQIFLAKKVQNSNVGQITVAVYSSTNALPLSDFPQDGTYEFDIVVIGY